MMRAGLRRRRARREQAGIREEIITTFPRVYAFVLGIIQIVLWLVSYAGATVAQIFLADLYYIYDGFWCGSFFMTSGISMMTAAGLPVRRRIYQAIGTAVITFIFAGVELGLSIDGLIVNVDYPYVNTTYAYNYPVMELANGLMIAASGIQTILVIVQVVICVSAMKQYSVLPILPQSTVDGQAGLQTSGVAVVGAQPQFQTNINAEYSSAPPSYDIVQPPPYTKQ